MLICDIAQKLSLPIGESDNDKKDSLLSPFNGCTLAELSDGIESLVKAISLSACDCFIA
jgi:hypothetical protein